MSEGVHMASASPDARQTAVANRNARTIRPGRELEPVILTLPFRDAPKIIPLLIDPSVNQFTLGRVCSRYFLTDTRSNLA